MQDRLQHNFFVGDEVSGIGLPVEKVWGGNWISGSRAIGGIRVPVIAAIKKDAFDLGLEWALSADLRIASESSSFDFPMWRKA